MQLLWKCPGSQLCCLPDLCDKMVFLCNSELCGSGGKSKRGNIDFSFYGADLPGGSDSSPMAFGTYRNLAELCRNFGAGRNHVICDFEEIVSQISELMVVWAGSLLHQAFRKFRGVQPSCF